MHSPLYIGKVRVSHTTHYVTLKSSMVTHIEATEIERRTAAEKLYNLPQHLEILILWILCFPNIIRKYFYM